MELLFLLEFVLPLILGVCIFWWSLKKSAESGEKIFGRIREKSQALKIVHDISIAFYIIFAILILFRIVRVVFYPESLFTNILYGFVVDVLLVLVPAFLLQKKKGLFYSLLLFSYPLLTLWGYFILIQKNNLNKIVVVDVFILLFTLYGATRALQAVLYLRGR